MGAGQSTTQSDTPPRGLHVLRVTPSSPAFHANIEPFFDFVVGFEGDTLSSDAIDATALEKIVESHENRTLNLLVWNSKSKRTRTVAITPSRVWSQQGISDLQQSPSSAQPSLLGLSMRLCQLETAADNVWHVLDVLEGSPAESAGLVPMGWSGGLLSAENDFYDLVDAHVDKPLRVYVYSYDFEYVHLVPELRRLPLNTYISTLREVVLIPNRHWGGEGLLGCVFGFGLLHRIPPQPDDRVPGTLPAELQEQDDEYGAQDLFVPADATDTNEGLYNPSHLTEWRHQEQDQWDRELQAGMHTTSRPASEDNDHIHEYTHESSRNAEAMTRFNNAAGPSRFLPANSLATLNQTRNPQSLMNGNSST